MVGLLSWLLLYRILGATLGRGPVGLFSVLLLSIFAAALTAVTEAVAKFPSGIGTELVPSWKKQLEKRMLQIVSFFSPNY